MDRKPFVKKKDLIGKVFTPSFDGGKKSTYGYIIGGKLNGEDVMLSLNDRDYEYNASLWAIGNEIEAYMNGQWINLRLVGQPVKSGGSSNETIVKKDDEDILPTSDTQTTSEIIKPPNIPSVTRNKKPLLSAYETQLVNNIKNQFREYARQSLESMGNIKSWQINKVLDALEL